jgi:phosphoribosyl 1,2-cyclic phosphodiesterase
VRVTFCGVRGSMPASGPEFVRYGGHTSCVAVARDGEAPTLVLDAGTGLRRLTALLGDAPFRGTVLLGHLHWDHVHGMPFFRAGAREGSRVDVRLPGQGEDAEQVLARMMSPPTFPIRPAQLGPGWRFTSLEAGAHTIEGFSVLALDIPHKGGRTFGYRVDDGAASMAYLSDHDPRVLGQGPDGLGARHEAALALVDGVDLLVHDAHITAAEVPHLGFLGHACADYALGLAEQAGARSVALFHHAYERTDDELDELATGWQTRSRVPVLVAREGVVVDLHVTARGPDLALPTTS